MWTAEYAPQGTTWFFLSLMLVPLFLAKLTSVGFDRQRSLVTALFNATDLSDSPDGVTRVVVGSKSSGDDNGGGSGEGGSSAIATARRKFTSESQYVYGGIILLFYVVFTYMKAPTGVGQGRTPHPLPFPFSSLPLSQHVDRHGEARERIDTHSHPRTLTLL